MVIVSKWYDWLELKGIDYGQYLKKCRNDMNLSQQELALLLSTSKQTISNWETKARKPSVKSIQRFNEIYTERMKVSIYEEYLVDLSKNRPKNNYLAQNYEGDHQAAESMVGYDQNVLLSLEKEIAILKNDKTHLEEKLNIKDDLIHSLNKLVASLNELIEKYKKGD